MRKVEIVHEPGDQRPLVAVDRQTGQRVLGLRDYDFLVETRHRLGWQVVEKQAAQSQAAR
jgi:hypothetical protein